MGLMCDTFAGPFMSRVYSTSSDCYLLLRLPAYVGLYSVELIYIFCRLLVLTIFLYFDLLTSHKNLEFYRILYR